MPLQNLLNSARKHVVIRPLVSEFTHLSKFYYNDKKDKKGILNNYVFQNTYSYNLLREKIRKIGKYKVKFIDDKFDGNKLNKEFKKDKKGYPGNKVLNGHPNSWKQSV